MQSNREFVISYFKKLPIRLIALVLLFGGALFLFGIVVHEIFWEQEDEFDQYVFNFIATHFTSDGVTDFMEDVSFFASSTFLQIAYSVLVVFYVIFKNFKRAVEAAVIGIGGFCVNYLMKLSFRRPRPSDPLIDPLHNFSFPSGHATSSFIFYGLLAYLIWKTDIPKTYKYLAAILLLLFSLLIGFSRVYLRLHYASDVLAGFCIGFAWLILVTWLFKSLKKKTDEEQLASDTAHRIEHP